MGITAGMVMFAAGILGLIGSIVLLCFLPRIFDRQRKDLLEKLEKEKKENVL